MNWLERRLAILLATTGHGSNPSQQVRAHRAVLRDIQAFVGEVALRDGVTACFASHDGLALEFAGRASESDALPAMAQAAIDAADRAARVLGLGSLRQLVLVGADHKLAVFIVGGLVVGIVAPVTVDLGALLAT